MTGDVRDRLLAVVWDRVRGLTADNVRNYAGAARALDAGASAEDVIAAMTEARYETAFGLLYALDYGTEVDSVDAANGWMLVETFGPDKHVRLMPSPALASLYESLLMADPTGREGQDFLS